MRRSQGIYNAKAIAPFFHAAKYRRVDWLGQSDSNEVFGGTGRNHGIQYALKTAGYNLYGPGVFSANENNGSGSSAGYFANHSANGARTNDNAACPASVNVFNPFTVGALVGPMFGTSYAWYQNDAQSDASGNNGITINHGSVWNCNLAWNGHFRYSKLTVAEGTGAFRPNIRLGGSPFTILAQSAANITTGDGAYTPLLTETLSISAATRNIDLQFRWHSGAQQGPVYLLWQMAESPDVTAGVQYSTMVYRGAQGMLEFATAMTASDTGMDEYLSFCTSRQNNTPMALISINTGLNDRSDDGQLSIGPNAGLDAATPDGYADNCKAIMNKIIARWSALGYPKNNLFFFLWPSHPVSYRDDGELVGYRRVMRQLADTYSNTAALDTDIIMGAYVQRNATTWYNSSGGDTFHMTQTGYEQTSLLCIKAIEEAVGL